MIKKDMYTDIRDLCCHYQVSQSFFVELENAGVITITQIDELACIHEDELITLEKVIRIHQDLKINVEGIDVVLNLLEKIERQKQYIRQLESQSLKFN